VDWCMGGEVHTHILTTDWDSDVALVKALHGKPNGCELKSSSSLCLWDLFPLELFTGTTSTRGG